MKFQKLKLKKNKVMELSSGVETLPREATNQAAGGVTTSRAYCATLGCGTYTEVPCMAETLQRRCVTVDGNCETDVVACGMG
ncbi:hypothetical protein [Flavobacterium sp. W21_SRS_FM6]|uniref:hypothetical protein n=1 Tax=Flavobacterium sp. W21_SRS_FM6 TaxID=3240268 RepID=UPI003F91960E